jgi:hypothetical protein
MAHVGPVGFGFIRFLSYFNHDHDYTHSDVYIRMLEHLRTPE